MSEQHDERERKPRLNLTTSQVAASALAACCSSIAASYLGVAGTVIGAAVGSVIATIGTAIWGHLFRTGGDRIKQTLSVNGEIAEDGGKHAPPEAAPVPAGRFYGADAPVATEPWTAREATAETRLIAPTPAPTSPRFLKYRKPIGVAAAILAFFSVSIVVGAFLGAPVRNAGAATTPSSTTTATVTKTEQGRANDGSSSSTGAASAGSSATSSATPSDSATSSATASSTASPGTSASSTSSAGGAATPTQGQPQATNTGSPNS